MYLYGTVQYICAPNRDHCIEQYTISYLFLSTSDEALCAGSCVTTLPKAALLSQLVFLQQSETSYLILPQLLSLPRVAHVQ